MNMNNDKNLYVDIHAIQTVPPSNINRDEAGAPKTADYGGVTRSRISSQSWKRAIREYFKDHMEAEDLGVRTLDMVAYLADRVQKLNPDFSHDDAMKGADAVLNHLGSSTTKSKTAEDKHKVLKSLLFIGDKQADQLAQAIIDGRTKNDKKDKDYLESIMQDNPSVDLSLFGRMVAGDPNINEDASVQMAHAISTHAIQNDFDFFVANDDLSNNGARMLGNTEFTSSTMYRYANIAGHHLIEQLNEDKDKAIKTMELFIKGFALTMPSGHVTSFANQTLPDALVVTVRNDRPVNLVNGFENPVSARDNHGYANKSIQRLDDEFKKVQSFVNKPEFTLTIGMKDLLGDDQGNLGDLLNNFADQIKPLLSKD